MKTYSAAETAEQLGCSERWLVEQVRANRFPASKIGRSWRFSDQDIADAMSISANSARRKSPVVIDNAITGIRTGLTATSRKRLTGA